MNRGIPMNVRCPKCGAVLQIADRVPVGRSFAMCSRCGARVNIFAEPSPGSVMCNLAGVRFIHQTNCLNDVFCEPGELWKVIQVVRPCPDKGKGKACELENRGKCPNQRLLVKPMSLDRTYYRTCLYRKGRKIFEKHVKVPVGRSRSRVGSTAATF